MQSRTATACVRDRHARRCVAARKGMPRCGRCLYRRGRVDDARGTVSGQGDVVLVDIERFKQVVGEMVETCVGVGQPRINEGESDGKRGALARRLLAFDGGVCHGLALSIPRAVRSTVPRVDSPCYACARANVKVRRSAKVRRSRCGRVQRCSGAGTRA